MAVNNWFREVDVDGVVVVCIHDYDLQTNKYRIRFIARQGDLAADPSWLPTPKAVDAVLNAVLDARDIAYSQGEFFDLTSADELRGRIAAYRKAMEENEKLRRQVQNQTTLRKGL